MLSRSSLLVSVAAAALSAAAPAQAGGIDGLKAEIEALTQKVQELEAERSRPPPVPANVVTGGDFEGSYKLPGSNTSLKFGGYVKLDAIYDFDQKGGDQQGGVTVDSATTPVDQDTGHFQMSVRQTRFTFDSRTASEDMGTVRAYLEVDFNDSDSATETVSNSHNPRLRHGFVTMGPWLFGQSWSTYIDTASYTDLIDFNGPAGQAFIRQAQIRYTRKFGASELNLAVENPQPVVSGGGTSSGERDRAPDFAFRLRHGGKWGHVSFQGVAQYLTAESTTTAAADSTDDALLWGLGFSGRLNLWDKDNLRFHFNGGDGIGRYMLGVALTEAGSAVYDTANNELDTVAAYGGYLAYQHYWIGKWRSNLVVGFDHVKNPGVQANTRLKDEQSLHANLIWAATGKTNIGLEYSIFHATSENGDSGAISRLRFAVQHSF